MKITHNKQREIKVDQKTIRLSELLSLLLVAPDTDRGKQIERTITICAMNDARWWEQIGGGYTAEGLISYCNRPAPRRLPPVPYEELP